MTGNTKGDIHVWKLPKFNPESKSQYIPLSNAQKINKGQYLSAIDDIHFVDRRIISKSINGKIEVWDSDSYEVCLNI